MNFYYCRDDITKMELRYPHSHNRPPFQFIDIEEFERRKFSQQITDLYQKATDQQDSPLHLTKCSVKGCNAYKLSDNRSIVEFLNCNAMISCEISEICAEEDLPHFCNNHADQFLEKVSVGTLQKYSCDRCIEK
jgi:hypothetical protein